MKQQDTQGEERRHGQGWQQLPVPLTRSVEDTLGAPVVWFDPVEGGFSGEGVVGIAATGQRRRMFVKAVRTDSGPAADYRLEAVVAGALPSAVPTPRLRLAADSEGWILLGFDVANGRLAREPWETDELHAALAALTTTAQLLTPTPLADLPTVADRMAGRCLTWRTLNREGRYGPLERAGLSSWERINLDRLADVEGRLPHRAPDASLLHFDLRHDNCFVTTTGEVTFVDWGRACQGHPVTDLICLLLESDLGGQRPQDVFDQHSLGQAADPIVVDEFLVALASYWTRAASIPADERSRRLRARQQRSRRATMQWLVERWG